MNLVHYNPTRRIGRSAAVRDNFFDNLFDDLLTPFIAQGNSSNLQKTGNMKVDIFEKDDVIYLEAELPGMAKDDVKVDVKGKLITISGERKSNEEISKENCYRRERTYGKFERTFSLPFEIRSSDVKAKFNNGILELEIPKPEEQLKQQITIN